MHLKQHYSIFFIGERLWEIIHAKYLAERRWDYADEVKHYLYWLDIHRFDRRKINQRLAACFSRQEEGLQA